MVDDSNNRIDNNSESFQVDYSKPQYSLNRKRKERSIRKKRKKINNIKSFLRFLTVVVLLYLSYRLFYCSKWYFPKDTFTKHLERIELSNNSLIPDKVLYAQLSGLKTPITPVFFLRTKGIQSALYKNQLVKKVYIRRYGFPARLKIVIVERQPKVLIKRSETALPIAIYTDDDIFIPYQKYMQLPKNSDTYLILTNSSNLKKDLNIEKVKEIQKISDDIEKYSNEKVEYVDMRNLNDVYVKIQSTSLRIGVLDSTVSERIKRIYTILPQIKEVNSKVEYVDLSWDKVNFLKLVGKKENNVDKDKDTAKYKENDKNKNVSQTKDKANDKDKNMTQNKNKDADKSKTKKEE